MPKAKDKVILATFVTEDFRDRVNGYADKAGIPTAELIRRVLAWVIEHVRPEEFEQKFPAGR